MMLLTSALASLLLMQTRPIAVQKRVRSTAPRVKVQPPIQLYLPEKKAELAECT